MVKNHKGVAHLWRLSCWITCLNVIHLWSEIQFKSHWLFVEGNRAMLTSMVGLQKDTLLTVSKQEPFSGCENSFVSSHLLSRFTIQILKHLSLRSCPVRFLCRNVIIAGPQKLVYIDGIELPQLCKNPRCNIWVFIWEQWGSSVWVAGTLWARSEVLRVDRQSIRGGADCSASPHPPHCCALYPLVHPTSIPLQFLSTFCSPLKEIGFKPWHELAPQIDLILPHPGDTL